MANLSKNIPVEEGFLGAQNRKSYDFDEDFSRAKRKYRMLRRWLIKQSGRPWNDIYSDLCSNSKKFQYSPKYTVQDMICGLVDNDLIVEDDGSIWQIGPGGSIRFNPEGYNCSVGWIHPESGIFYVYKKQKRRLRYRVRERDDIVVIDNMSQYQKIDGVWYFLRFKKLKDADSSEVDRHFNAIYSWNQDEKYTKEEWIHQRDSFEFYNKQNVFCCEKRQLNSKEIKKIIRSSKNA